MESRTPNPAFETLTDLELMQLQEMFARNFDYTEETFDLLDAFIRMDSELEARGVSANSKKNIREHRRRAA